jgi:hypothetical protein
MKEEMLRSYLADELFTEKNYLRPGEAETFKWTDKRSHKLIEVLRLAIEGVSNDESERISERRINQLLNTPS